MPVWDCNLLLQWGVNSNDGLGVRVGQNDQCSSAIHLSGLGGGLRQRIMYLSDAALADVQAEFQQANGNREQEQSNKATTSIVGGDTKCHPTLVPSPAG